jgi:hypothetical protein
VRGSQYASVAIATKKIGEARHRKGPAPPWSKGNSRPVP